MSGRTELLDREALRVDAASRGAEGSTLAVSPPRRGDAHRRPGTRELACVQLTVEQTTAVLAPYGNIDISSVPDLVFVAGALPEEVTEVVWDLRHVRFMDSAGLHLLMNQRKDCRIAGRGLRVRGLRDQPMRLVELIADLRPWEPWLEFLEPAAPRCSSAR
ncbi:STAS domain-containing protein [Streptomyces bauhiniae]|uniref:STAS domain-containing protein n=1 Tax=Streptomyces bauhiniae TaxID=2340725 RepID=UPI0035E2040A